eukprot:TRINITY_DN233_c0_g1_i1.p1 TRINITY_DN233_c0_g1~~TRINITY_DN233_c0_g1_i1.p1  ORF type:complete len:317 (+),score=102.97 TRINITY_DN233_c0_g1_i1:74-1024(+)
MLVVCQGCGKACDAGCTCIQNSCGCVSDFLCPYDRPSPMFVVFSTIVNALLITFAVLGLTEDSHENEAKELGLPENSPDDINMWFIVTLVIGIVNIIFAFYIYYRFSRMTSWREGQTENRKSARAAAWELCAYDIGVCLYMCFAIFMLVWVFIDKRCDTDIKEGGAYVHYNWCVEKLDKQDWCEIIIWVYVFLGGCVLIMSVCSTACNPPQPRPGSQYQQQHNVNVNVAPQPAYAPYNTPAQQQQYAQQTPPQPHMQPGGYPAAPSAANNWGDQPQQQQQHQASAPPQETAPKSNAEKAGALVGGLIGKGAGFLKK